MGNDASTGYRGLRCKPDHLESLNELYAKHPPGSTEQPRPKRAPPRRSLNEEYLAMPMKVDKQPKQPIITKKKKSSVPEYYKGYERRSDLSPNRPSLSRSYLRLNSRLSERQQATGLTTPSLYLGRRPTTFRASQSPKRRVRSSSWNRTRKSSIPPLKSAEVESESILEAPSRKPSEPSDSVIQMEAHSIESSPQSEMKAIYEHSDENVRLYEQPNVYVNQIDIAPLGQRPSISSHSSARADQSFSDSSTEQLTTSDKQVSLPWDKVDACCGVASGLQVNTSDKNVGVSRVMVDVSCGVPSNSRVPISLPVSPRGDKSESSMTDCANLREAECLTPSNYALTGTDPAYSFQVPVNISLLRTTPSSNRVEEKRGEENRDESNVDEKNKDENSRDKNSRDENSLDEKKLVINNQEEKNLVENSRSEKGYRVQEYKVQEYRVQEYRVEQCPNEEYRAENNVTERHRDENAQDENSLSHTLKPPDSNKTLNHPQFESDHAGIPNTAPFIVEVLDVGKLRSPAAGQISSNQEGPSQPDSSVHSNGKDKYFKDSSRVKCSCVNGTSKQRLNVESLRSRFSGTQMGVESDTESLTTTNCPKPTPESLSPTRRHVILNPSQNCVSCQLANQMSPESSSSDIEQTQSQREFEPEYAGGHHHCECGCAGSRPAVSCSSRRYSAFQGCVPNRLSGGASSLTLRRQVIPITDKRFPHGVRYEHNHTCCRAPVSKLRVNTLNSPRKCTVSRPSSLSTINEAVDQPTVSMTAPPYEPQTNKDYYPVVSDATTTNTLPVTFSRTNWNGCDPSLLNAEMRCSPAARVGARVPVQNMNPCGPTRPVIPVSADSMAYPVTLMPKYTGEEPQSAWEVKSTSSTDSDHLILPSSLLGTRALFDWPPKQKICPSNCYLKSRPHQHTQSLKSNGFQLCDKALPTKKRSIHLLKPHLHVHKGWAHYKSSGRNEQLDLLNYPCESLQINNVISAAVEDEAHFAETTNINHNPDESDVVKFEPQTCNALSKEPSDIEFRKQLCREIRSKHRDLVAKVGSKAFSSPDTMLENVQHNVETTIPLHSLDITFPRETSTAMNLLKHSQCHLSNPSLSPFNNRVPSSPRARDTWQDCPPPCKRDAEIHSCLTSNIVKKTITKFDPGRNAASSVSENVVEGGQQATRESASGCSVCPYDEALALFEAKSADTRRKGTFWDFKRQRERRSQGTCLVPA